MDIAKQEPLGTQNTGLTDCMPATCACMHVYMYVSVCVYIYVAVTSIGGHKNGQSHKKSPFL